MSYNLEMRKYVGHKPIMATASMCVLYDMKKGILLEKRSDDGMWSIPGGALKLGEDQKDALLREVKEETNLDIYNPKFFTVRANVHMVYPGGDEVYYTDIVYVVTEYKGDLKPDKESTELRWFKLDELPNGIEPNQVDYINKFVSEYENYI